MGIDNGLEGSGSGQHLNENSNVMQSTGECVRYTQ
jgi:hypothetical protein